MSQSTEWVLDSQATIDKSFFRINASINAFFQNMLTPTPSVNTTSYTLVPIMVLKHRGPTSKAATLHTMRTRFLLSNALLLLCGGITLNYMKLHLVNYARFNLLEVSNFCATSYSSGYLFCSCRFPTSLDGRIFGTQCSQSRNHVFMASVIQRHSTLAIFAPSVR